MIYLDHHATTPINESARSAVLRALQIHGGNPSSVHALGRQARAVIERARSAVAAALSAHVREMVFTSGGTEAVHLALRGVGEGTDCTEVLVDPGGHPALRRAAEAFAQSRSGNVFALRPGPGGGIEPAELDRALAARAGKVLVALSYVQHETGTILDLPAVAEFARARGARLVVDAVQAFGKIPIDAPTLGVDALAVSSHKIGGPPGTGAVWLRPGCGARAMLTGGGQERGLRAGTENVLGIAGFGGAAEVVSQRLAAMDGIAFLRAKIESVLATQPDVFINGSPARRVSTVCHVSVRGAAGEELVAALDLEGFCVSSGPACSSGRPGPSESMRSMFPDDPWRADSALRISLGPETSAHDVDRFIAVIPEVIRRVRA